MEAEDARDHYSANNATPRGLRFRQETDEEQASRCPSPQVTTPTGRMTWLRYLLGRQACTTHGSCAGKRDSHWDSWISSLWLRNITWTIWLRRRLYLGATRTLF